MIELDIQVIGTLLLALERLEEARATGAQALVTACPWCERVFKDALTQAGDTSLKVMDVMELVMISQGGTTYGA